MTIRYVTGDATKPSGSDPRIIVHVCNDVGAWGKGFVLAVSKQWPEPEQQYRAWARGETDLPFVLGQVQFVLVAPNLWVANLIGQRDIRRRNGIPPIRYDALRHGFRRVAAQAQAAGASVHMPRISAGLAGGEWSTINQIIEEELTGQGIAVTVYDLPQHTSTK